MRKEMAVYLDKKLFRGKHFKDIPVNDRKFILRSLDGFKTKLNANAAWRNRNTRLSRAHLSLATNPS
jgi:hypothetical protein